MTGSRTIVITGASDGIGAAAARRLVAGGERGLLLVGRSAEKTRAVANELGVQHRVADFADLADVRALAAGIARDHPRVDVLANNAGAIFGPRTTTVDGHELTLQVDHLAPFLLTTLLLPQLQAGAGVVVTTSSSAAKRYGRIDPGDLQHTRDHSPNRAYGDAKLLNILFTRGLHARYGDRGIHAVAFDPGNIATNFASDTTSAFRFVYRTPLRRLILKDGDRGGANLAFFIEGEPGRVWQAGRFYTERRLATPNETAAQVSDDALVDEVWRRSADLVALPAASA